MYIYFLLSMKTFRVLQKPDASCSCLARPVVCAMWCDNRRRWSSQYRSWDTYETAERPHAEHAIVCTRSLERARPKAFRRIQARPLATRLNYIVLQLDGHRTGREKRARGPGRSSPRHEQLVSRSCGKRDDPIGFFSAFFGRWTGLSGFDQAPLACPRKREKRHVCE